MKKRMSPEEIKKIKTPKSFIFNKNGVEYVKVEYMKHMLNKFYAPWEWRILKTEIVKIDDKPVFVMVNGRLIYTDHNGVTRSCDMIAGHRIQYNKNGQLVDPGNDLKAAVTDTFKKAINFALDISADVYRGTTSIREEEIEELEEYFEKGVMEYEKKEDLHKAVEFLEINSKNIDIILSGAKFRCKQKNI